MKKFFTNLTVLITSAIIFTQCAKTENKTETPASGYTAAFNLDGGSFSTPADTMQMFVQGAKVKRPSIDPTKPNLIFDGWYKDEAKTIAFNFDTILSSNWTIYAKWRMPYSFTANFKSLKISTKKYDSIVAVQQTFTEGRTNIATRPTTNPADYSGLVFDNWYTDTTFKTVFDFSGKLTKDTVIYANWKALINNKQYRIVKIGSQIWLGENLNDSNVNNPLSNQTSCYNNLASNCDIYGRLYTNDAALKEDTLTEGWHLPSKDEYLVLLNYLGGENEATKAKLLVGGSSGFEQKLSGKTNYRGEYHSLDLNFFLNTSTETILGSSYTLTNSANFETMASVSVFADKSSVRLLKD